MLQGFADCQLEERISWGGGGEKGGLSLKALFHFLIPLMLLLKPGHEIILCVLVPLNGREKTSWVSVGTHTLRDQTNYHI